MKSGFWQDLTTRDFNGLDPEQTVVLLPVAAIEQHGPHLPLSTDAEINAGIVKQTLAMLPDGPTVLVLPALVVGDSLEHTSYPGTLHASTETLLAMWSDVGRCVARTGLRKLLVLNSHGGQVPLIDILSVRLRSELGMLVVRANYFAFGTPANLFSSTELEHGIHGGEIETSLMMHLRPDLVRVDQLDNFAGLTERMSAQNKFLSPEGATGFGWLSQDLNAAGVCGNASRADAKRGAKLLEHVSRSLVTLIKEIAQTPLSTLKPSGNPSDLGDRNKA